MSNNIEGVITILDSHNALIGIVRKDGDRKNIFYKCEEMSFDDIKDLLGVKTVDN